MQINGSIGYVELAYATQTGMSYVSMQNAAGNWVRPSAESFQAAAETADWANSQDFNLIITNARGAQAWPVAATNFILMYKQPRNPERSKTAIDFFTWALENGQPQAAELHYVPLPAELVQQVKQYWASEFKFTQ
jgi:phosphate transport system substrate-binding protein